jgi:alpha-L-fucosidase
MNEFKTPEFILHQLIDIVSKNGNLLLNIGPRPDGTIPEEVRHTLLEIGGWLKQNGEAIYDTTPWQVYGEGPTKVQTGFGHDKDTQPYTAKDFRFTRRGNTLYAIEMAWPVDGRVLIHALGSAQLGSAQQARALQITNVELVGSIAKLEYRQTGEALEVQIPFRAPGKYAYVFRVRMARENNTGLP